MTALVKLVIGLLAVCSYQGFPEIKAGRWSGTSKQSHGLQCYTDVAATEITVCKENEGFRTCFTKYNDKGQVTGRGCSTKDKVFFKECETHSYGDQVEKMCFCSYFLCNSSLPKASNFLLIVLVAMAVVVANACSCSSSMDTRCARPSTSPVSSESVSQCDKNPNRRDDPFRTSPLL